MWMGGLGRFPGKQTNIRGFHSLNKNILLWIGQECNVQSRGGVSKKVEGMRCSVADLLRKATKSPHVRIAYLFFYYLL